MWRSIPLLALLLATAQCQDMVTTGEGMPTEATPPLEKAPVKPTIRSLHISSNIKYRYATTLVSTRVINPTNKSGEATFTVTLPESAFISQFLMEIKDKVYKAYVKEKEEAKAIYQEAVHAGHFAGHVALDARDSNQFTVSVNIEAHGKVTFNLTYEQLLERNLGVYSNVININPQQIVEDMSVTVDIEEPSAIIDLEIPELQLSNEAAPEKHNENAKIKEISPNHKQVTWTPTLEEQKAQNKSGLSGQFIVKYDVDRSANPSQILVDEGYFVHFFAPEDLPKLRKHVIFVLDFSGSMGGRKLEQLKDAMKQIFSDLGPKDYFSIVIFQSWVEVWSPSGMLLTARPEYIGHWEKEKFANQENKTLNKQYVVEATPANIELARSFMGNYSDLGSTNIMGGLRTGLQLVDVGEELWANESDPPQPVVVFLTDGQPNVEEYDTNVIINKTKALNTKQSPIFSLAFGYGADYNFLRKLSLQNFGFARNIYEAADATQQLKNFYRTIASPLLSNVTFDYLPGQVDNSSNTKQKFPVFFSGSELVVAGRVSHVDSSSDQTIGELRATSAKGSTVYPIVINRTMFKPTSTGHLEKAWSYLTIQQLLDKIDSLDDGGEKNKTKKQALDLALQYAFVTPLTSLVVVKPNETEAPVDATKIKPGVEGPVGYGGAGGFPIPASASGASAIGFGSPMYSLARPMAPMVPPPAMMSQPMPGTAGSPHFTQSHRRIPILRTHSSKHVGGAYPSTTAGVTADAMNISSPHSGSMESSQAAPDVPTQLPNKVSLEDIKWIKPSANETFIESVLVDGNSYKIGLNETNSAFGDCQVNNTAGECHHIQYCALDIFKDDIAQFQPYKCPIPGSFLGVCCPKVLV